MPVTAVNGGTFNLGGPVMRGAPQYYNSGSSGTGATFTVAKDPAVAAGDLILVFMTWNGTGTNPAIAGFTGYAKTASVFAIALFSRIADGSEGSTFTVTFASGFNAAAVCVAYRNTNGVLDPVPASSGTITLAATAMTASGVTTAAPNDRMAWFGAVRANGAAAPMPVITVPGGLLQEGAQSATAGAPGANMGVVLADGLAQAAGATGAMTGTSSLSADVGAILVTIQSASVPASVTAGLAAVTAAARDATTGSNVSAHAGLAAAAGAGLAVQSGLGTIVGAYIDEARYTGGLTHAQAITHWNTNTGRVMACERIFMGHNNMTTTVPANVSACISAGRVCVLSYKPSYFGAAGALGGGASQAANDTAVNSFLTALLAALTAAGSGPQMCPIDLWQEPINSGIASTADFIAMFRHYYPIISSYGFTVGFCTSAASVWSGSENSYYPGDAFCDIVATDYYFPQYGTSSPPIHPLGTGTSQDAAQPADAASPPKPFGIYEMNSSTDPTLGCTQTQANAYWAYMLTYFQGRLHANQPCAPLVIFNSDSGSPNVRDSPIVVADGVTDPYGGGTATEYRNALIANLVDGLASVT
jgi:hypothetical protein